MKSLTPLFVASALLAALAANADAATRTKTETVPSTSSSSGLSIYQNPDGSYPSLANFVRDLNGTPCGVDCEQDAARRWGLLPRQHTEAR